MITSRHDEQVVRYRVFQLFKKFWPEGEPKEYDAYLEELPEEIKQEALERDFNPLEIQAVKSAKRLGEKAKETYEKDDRHRVTFVEEQTHFPISAGVQIVPYQDRIGGKGWGDFNLRLSIAYRPDFEIDLDKILALADIDLEHREFIPNSSPLSSEFRRDNAREVIDALNSDDTSCIQNFGLPSVVRKKTGYLFSSPFVDYSFAVISDKRVRLQRELIDAFVDKLEVCAELFRENDDLLKAISESINTKNALQYLGGAGYRLPFFCSLNREYTESIEHSRICGGRVLHSLNGEIANLAFLNFEEPRDDLFEFVIAQLALQSPGMPRDRNWVSSYFFNRSYPVRENGRVVGAVIDYDSFSEDMALSHENKSLIDDSAYRAGFYHDYITKTSFGPTKNSFDTAIIWKRSRRRIDYKYLFQPLERGEKKFFLRTAEGKEICAPPPDKEETKNLIGDRYRKMEEFVEKTVIDI